MEQVQKAPSNIVVSTILLSKPGIIVSVAFTGFAGMVVADKGLPPLSLGLLTMVSLLLSAAGSAILNNVLDKQIDLLMNRLSKRAHALEAVGEKTAIFIASLFIVIALFISLYYLNYITALLIVAAILSYTILYTLYLKRSSPYGTILGGLPGALPVLIGYSAIQSNIGLDGYILFAFMMLWQPPHFWALAQKYKLDYKKAGVPVMPVALGAKFTNIMILLYSISLLPLSLSFWFLGYASAYFAILAVIFGGYFEYIMIKSSLTNSGYGKAFAASIFYMLAIMTALILDLSLNSGNTVVTALYFH
jgi:protoheme IX farnesyltransferase